MLQLNFMKNYLHNIGRVTSMTCGASAYLPPDLASKSNSYLHNIGRVTSMTCGASAYLPPDPASESISEIIFSKGGNVSVSMSITSVEEINLTTSEHIVKTLSQFTLIL